MTGAGELLVVFAVLLGLMFSGMWVPFAIGVTALAYILATLGASGLKSLGLVAWGSVDSFTLTTAPLFILMSEILLVGGLGDRVYRGMSRLVVGLPGGLLQTNIAGCSVFSAISGSSIATAAAIGTVAIPQLNARGYDQRIAAGTLAAGGTLGILIPPSLGFILYGGFTETSISRLFIAGIVPGLMLSALFMLFVAAYTLAAPRIAPKEPREPWSGALLRQTIADLVPFGLLIGGVLGGIYGGFFTPTEAAAMGVALALLVTAIFGNLDATKLRIAMRKTVVVTAAIMFIVMCASFFSFATGMAGVPQKLLKTLQDAGLSTTGFLLAVIALYLVLGCVMESIGILVITIPVLYPLVKAYMIDPVWFGVLIVILIEIGMITPPFGMNLFVIQGVRNQGSLRDVAVGALPFVVIMIAFVGVLMVWPAIATWLPQRMR